MSNFYKDQRVVVTGGAGMIGSQLVRQLAYLGSDVLVLDNMSRGTDRVVNKNVSYAVGSADVSRPGICEHYFAGAFAVFNLAASVAGVAHNQTHHLSMFNENILLQTVPLHAAETVGVKHFLQVSSVCVYGPNSNHPAIEADDLSEPPHIANHGYAWSKRMGEQMAQVANIPHLVIVRPSNVYGIRDYFDEKGHVIPNLIRKILELKQDDELIMHSPAAITREFVFSTDTAAGMIAALERGGHREVYNIGSNGETCVSIGELVATILSLTGSTNKIKWTLRHNPGDPARWSSSTKLNELGWKHEVSIRDGLQQVIAWYKENK